ncbi:unnamed protein product [Schistosoma rodhaini]|uniref:Uncharacterized protein n=1 Tax=Schistosoma rodhaini TaxID=6188 RepID=A0AA85G677_9TREM|nr:unnamed protein product [Schistosoma rodhaini]
MNLSCLLLVNLLHLLLPVSICHADIPSFIGRKKLEMYFDCVIKGYKLQLISNLNTEFVKIMEKVEGEYANHSMNSSKSSEIKKCFENNAENAKRGLKENHPENCPIPDTIYKEGTIMHSYFSSIVVNTL